MHVKEEAKLKFGKERSSYVAAVRDEATSEQRVNLVNNPPYKWKRFEEFSEYFRDPGPADARGSQQKGSSTSPTQLRGAVWSPTSPISPASLTITPSAQPTSMNITMPLTGAGRSRVASPPPRLTRNTSGPAATVAASSVELDPPIGAPHIAALPKNLGTLLASSGSAISHTVTCNLGSESAPTWAAESVASTSSHTPELSPTLAVPDSTYAYDHYKAYANARRGTRGSGSRGQTKPHRKRSEAEMLRIDHHPAYFLQEEETAFGQSAKRKPRLTGPLVESGSEEDPMDDDYNASEGSNAPDEYSVGSPSRRTSIPSRPSRRWNHTLSRQGQGRSEITSIQPSAEPPVVLLERQAPRRLPRVILRLPPRPAFSGSDVMDVSTHSSETQVESPTHSNA